MKAQSQAEINSTKNKLSSRQKRQQK